MGRFLNIANPHLYQTRSNAICTFMASCPCGRKGRELNVRDQKLTSSPRYAALMKEKKEKPKLRILQKRSGEKEGQELRSEILAVLLDADTHCLTK